MRTIKNPEDFKRDLELESANYREAREISTKREALIKQLLALDHFASAAFEEAYEMLAPVRQLCKALGDLNAGRRSEMFIPSPRDGKRPPRSTDIQAQSRAAVYMHIQVPALGKGAARTKAAEKFGFDAKSIDYWRDQAMMGDADGTWTALFHQTLRVLTAQHPNSPERQAQALLKAHKRALRG